MGEFVWGTCAGILLFAIFTVSTENHGFWGGIISLIVTVSIVLYIDHKLTEWDENHSILD